MLGDDADRIGDHFRRQFGHMQDGENFRPVEGLGDARRLAQVERTGLAQETDHLLRQVFADVGKAGAHDLDFPFHLRIIDVEIETAPAQGVGDHAGAVAGENRQRLVDGVNHAQLRDGDLEIAQAFQQQRFKFIVGTIDFIDQQHRALLRQKTAQYRPLHEEILGEEQTLFAGQPLDRLAQVGSAAELVVELGAQHLGIEQLLAVFPVVKGFAFVDPLVALQPHQRKIDDLRKGFRQARSCRRRADLRSGSVFPSAGREKPRWQWPHRQCSPRSGAVP